MRVYNFLSAEFALSNIALRRMRISRFSEVNDPFELLAVNVGGSKDFRTAIRNWKRDLDGTKGMLCFSRHWENPVLWSHYAGKHHGIALGFDLADSVAKPVSYASDRLLASFPASGDPIDASEDFVESLLYTKYEHWGYEEEVRVFVQLDPYTREDGSYFYPFSEELNLREVVLGTLCPIPISRVRELIDDLYNDVQVRKARLAFKWFKVVPDERFEGG